METARHLTPEEKARRLASWERTLKTRGRSGPDDGGRGLVDEAICPLVARLNELPDLCTTQSCAGHTCRSASDGERYEIPASLWLRVSSRMAPLFYARAAAFASNGRHLIHDVRILWQPGGEEIIDLDFAGLPTGKFEWAAADIYEFFRHLQWVVGWPLPRTTRRQIRALDRHLEREERLMVADVIV